MKTEYYVCKKMRLLDFLMKKGYEVVDTLPDINNPRFKVWTFVKIPDLMAAVDEYYRTPLK